VGTVELKPKRVRTASMTVEKFLKNVKHAVQDLGLETTINSMIEAVGAGEVEKALQKIKTKTKGSQKRD